MMTVHEVSKKTGVSIRALQYYDRIGLLRPAAYSASGYRLYDETSLERLQQIMLFRELEFGLGEIQAILDRPDFDADRALRQQIRLLTLKKEHLEELITLAKTVREGGNTMDFQAFDTKKIDEYVARAKAEWGNTDAYREFEQRHSISTPEQRQDEAAQMMEIFRAFGAIRTQAHDGEAAKALVRQLQDFITAHYYTCTDKILYGLGQMYGTGGEFTENIDAAGGPGTAEFVKHAIEAYCKR